MGTPESDDSPSKSFPRRRRIDAAVDALDPARPETIIELRGAVAQRIRFRRDHSEPPEQTLIATKKALAEALGRRSVPLGRETLRALIDDTIQWFIATHYGDKPDRGH